jgi:CHAT domain-containing protein/Tfp pilus assembly protein PilF
MKEALESHTRALDLSKTLNNEHVDAEAFTNIGADYSDMGENLKALEYYTKALSVDRSAPLLSNIGLLYVELGQIQKALNSFRESLLLYRVRGDRGGQALIFNNLGLLYFRVGDNTSALNSFIKALPLTREVRFRYGEAIVLNNLGKVYSARGETSKALGYFNEALVLDREIKNRIGEGVSLATIGDVYATSGNLNKGLDFYEQALPIFRTSADGRHEASALIHMGRAYEQSRDVERGLECYRGALSIAKRMEDPYSESAATYGIAHVERNRGNWAAALSDIESALKIVETLRIGVLDQGLRASYSASVGEYYELYIDLLMQLDRVDPTKGYAARALETSERSRAQGLIEILQEARANIRLGVDPHLLERERSLQQLLEDKTERQIRLLTGQQDEKQAAAVKEEIEELLARFQEVEAEIRAASPAYAGLMQLQPFDLARIQKQVLDTDTVLLEYSLGTERSYLWAVMADSIASFELPNKTEVEEAARRVYGLLTERNRKIKSENALQRRVRFKRVELEYSHASSDLSEMVIGPVATLIRGKRLAIVADGALQYVPFAVLPITGGEDNEVYRSPLVVEHEIDNLPSASVLALSRDEMAERTLAHKMVAVLADPVFDRDDTRVKDKVEHRKTPEANPAAAFSESRLRRSVTEVRVGDQGHHLPRLVFTRQEAKSILGAAPAQENLQALDFNANRATATDPELGQYRMIHFATHGLLDSEHPELSGLVLSLVDEQGKPVNGFLDLEDIYNLTLSAELVTLSACETGLGKEVKGEGLIGLTRGFMYAGARRVVASLWKVDDAATAELMGRFYRGMVKERLRPVAALRQAQTEMQRQKRWADPYFWGAFTIQGEWR